MPEPMRILVTGASSGIGRALAEHYAQAGHVVGAVARRADLLEEFARECAGIVPLPADVTDAQAMREIIERFASNHGGLDMVTANAGIGQRSAQEGWDPDRARAITQINVVGAINTIAPAAGIMVKQGRGTIVGVSSLAAAVPLPRAAAYGASKAWMVFYLRSLALDLEPLGVRCCVVMPGHVPTAMVDGDKAGLITPGARRAAALIAERLARGDRTIRFPRKVALLSRVAPLVPARWRARLQAGRLDKRKAIRHGSAK